MGREEYSRSVRAADKRTLKISQQRIKRCLGNIFFFLGGEATRIRGGVALVFVVVVVFCTLCRWTLHDSPDLISVTSLVVDWAQNTNQVTLFTEVSLIKPECCPYDCPRQFLIQCHGSEKV